jgi:hypothetical protein
MLKYENMKTNKLLIIAFIGFLLFTACANNESVEACLTGQTFGFLGGLWHGIIAPFDLIAMLFRDDVTVYAQNNNGAWYALGFILGSGGWGILGSKGAKSRKRKRDC